MQAIQMKHRHAATNSAFGCWTIVAGNATPA
jgi:hypothetical protein